MPALRVATGALALAASIFHQQEIGWVCINEEENKETLRGNETSSLAVVYAARLARLRAELLHAIFVPIALEKRLLL